MFLKKIYGFLNLFNYDLFFFQKFIYFFLQKIDFKPFFFKFLNDMGTQYFFMRLDFLFSLNSLGEVFFFDTKSVSLGLVDFGSNFFFKNIFFRLKKNLNIGTLLKQDLNFSLIYDYFFFPKKLEIFFKKHTKLYNHLLIFKSSLWFEGFTNNMLAPEIKDFLLKNVSFIFRDFLFTDFITFVFGSNKLKAFSMCNSSKFYLADFQYLFILMFHFFVDHYMKKKFFNFFDYYPADSFFDLLEFFFVYSDFLKVDIFLKNMPSLFKKQLLLEFFGLSNSQGR